jgi:hypothetical protein
MLLRRIRYFLAVAGHGDFTRVAEVLRAWGTSKASPTAFMTVTIPRAATSSPT